MIKLDIGKHCRSRNQPNSAAYLRQQGFSHWVAHQLAGNKSRSISFNDLERLCVVFKCTPNDIFEWLPNNLTDEQNTKHPLAPLIKQKSTEEDISHLSFSQLKEIARIVKEKK